MNSGEPMKETQLNKDLESLEKNIAVLHEAIDKLEDRLSMVLFPPELIVRETEMKELEEQPNRSNLAEMIYSRWDSVGGANRKLLVIIERLDL